METIYVAWIECILTPPQFKNFTKLSNKTLSRISLLILNLNIVLNLVLLVFLKILIVKLPSPEVKPANQSDVIFVEVTNGLLIGTILGNILIKSSDKPLFIEAFIDKSLLNPGIDKSSPLDINSKAFLKRI